MQTNISRSTIANGTAALAMCFLSPVAEGVAPIFDNEYIWGNSDIRVDATSNYPNFGFEAAPWFIAGHFDQPEFKWFSRETTEQEHVIAQLREYEAVDSGWDGESAAAPIVASLHAASNFVCAMSRNMVAPEPMLNETGEAGLFWHTDSIYADLAFLSGGRIAYFIENAAGRHKGVAHFDGMNLPEPLVQLLPTT